MLKGCCHSVTLFRHYRRAASSAVEQLHAIAHTLYHEAAGRFLGESSIDSELPLGDEVHNRLEQLE